MRKLKKVASQKIKRSSLGRQLSRLDPSFNKTDPTAIDGLEDLRLEHAQSVKSVEDGFSDSDSSVEEEHTKSEEEEEGDSAFAVGGITHGGAPASTVDDDGSACGDVEGGAPAASLLDSPTGFFGEEKGMELIHTHKGDGSPNGSSIGPLNGSDVVTKAARLENDNKLKKKRMEKRRLHAESLRNTIASLGGSEDLQTGRSRTNVSLMGQGKIRDGVNSILKGTSEQDSKDESQNMLFSAGKSHGDRARGVLVVTGIYGVRALGSGL